MIYELMARSLLIIALIGFGLPRSMQDWQAADRAITRLAPAAFATLPPGVRHELERRGCTIPQPFTAKSPANVIKGRFTAPNRTDWAVLCSRQQRSSILVFRSGIDSTPLDLAPQADIDSLQTVDGRGTIGYSRTIAVATRRYIQDHQKSAGATNLTRLDHEGIDDLFIEKGSTIWYWDGDRWLRMPGAD